MAITFPMPTGFILPKDRTDLQNEAHAKAMAVLPRFNSLGSAADLLKTLDVPKGTKVMLTDAWKHPDVVVDLGGKAFTGFGQHTGSCVGVSEGNGVTTVTCVQRLIADNPMQAYVVFWPFPYGRTRQAEGDRGQGEGAVDSVMGETLVKQGFFDITQPGLPQFQWDEDGLWLANKSIEFQWSDGARIDPKWVALAQEKAGMTKVVVDSVEQEIAGIINGYPVLTGCSQFVSSGSIVGSGDTAYVRGHFDSNGGHSTSRLAAWLHPNDGWLIGYSNQWDTRTYPKDPAGLGRCCVWIPQSEEEKMLRRLGGDRGETMLLSHAPSVPVQPAVLDWFISP